MKSFKWKIYCGPKFIDSGTIQGENERDALREVLTMKGQMDADKSYAITVGGTTMSSYGDEFQRSAGVAGWGDDVDRKPMKGRYHYDPVKEDILKRLTKATMKVIKAAECQKHMDGQHRWMSHGRARPDECACGATRKAECAAHPSGVHLMSDIATNPLTGERHAQCASCGFVEPRGTDALVGTALEAGRKGDLILVKIDAGGNVSGICGADIAINERLRQGAAGRFYPPTGYATGGVVKSSPTITVKHGVWTDGFTTVEAVTIRRIATLQGLDPHLIVGAVRKSFAWEFYCSDGGTIMISDEMIAQFKG